MFGAYGTQLCKQMIYNVKSANAYVKDLSILFQKLKMYKNYEEQYKPTTITDCPTLNMKTKTHTTVVLWDSGAMDRGVD